MGDPTGGMQEIHFEDLGPVDDEEGGEGATGGRKDEVGAEVDLTSDGGVKKTILTLGEGWEKPSPGDEVYVHYVGTLAEDGSKFDSSRDRGDLFNFTLGQGSVIKGWDVGVASMKRGETSKLRCTSTYAYGERGFPPKIPAGATLDFEVELLSWKSVNDISGDGGVIRKVLKAGEGYSKPGKDDEVCVSYVASTEGNEFIRTREHGIEFILSEGHFCEALKLAVAGMKKGEEVELKVKPTYAFGEVGYPGTSQALVRSNQSIVMTVTLLSWKTVERIEADGSLVKKVMTEGEGYQKPNEGATVTIMCGGKTSHDEVFLNHDQNDPITFKTGENAVPECVDRAVMTMKKGEVAIVTADAQWAFGSEGKSFGSVAVAPGERVYYTLGLLSFEKAKESWDMNTKEKIENADAKREDGNKFFKEKKFAKALKKYEASLKLVEYDTDFSDEDKVLSKKIKLSCQLNSAACRLKTEEFKECCTACDAALKISSTSVKALFRRAQARTAMGDFDLAIVDLKDAMEHEPGNKDVRVELKKVKSLMRAQDQKDMNFYGNMFKA